MNTTVESQQFCNSTRSTFAPETTEPHPPISVLTAALEAHAAGLSVLPPVLDGSKRPLPYWRDDAGKPTWKPAQQTRADMSTLHAWFDAPQQTGLGLVTGPVSGNLELFEFDDLSAYQAFCQAAEAAGLGEVVARIQSGYCEQTPKPGIHWLYRCEDIGGNVKLASRPKTAEEMTHPKDKMQVLIETRGTGGFVIVAPSNGSVHPSGKEYRLLSGGFGHIATIAPEERRDLFALARSFDWIDATAAPARPATPRPESVDAGDSRPGDDFNARADWRELLEGAGWTFVYRQGEADYWRRPGKKQGVSACTRWEGKDFFYCFSTSTEFEPNKPYDKFGFHVLTAFGGDFKAATRALSEAGYGSPRPKASTRTEGSTRPSREPGEDDEPLAADPVLLERCGIETAPTARPAEASRTAGVVVPPIRPFTEDELDQAQLTPMCIVKNYLYADLATQCAPGGTGKTTLTIYEAIHIALGLDLWGCRVLNPGGTLFITAEDSGERFAARMRELMNALNLDAYQRKVVRERVTVWDVSGSMIRLAELDYAGNIRLTGLADGIVAAHKNAGLVQIVFDPAISFGPGERIVNDGEQSIVDACRRIISGLNCCVKLNQHTGKANARNGAIDQYAGRGGTALPDGCRMVTVLSPPSESGAPPPDGWSLAPDESGFILNRSKLSHAPPNLPPIWIRRRGWSFEHFILTPRNEDEIRNRDADLVWKVLDTELQENRRHTSRSLEDTNKTKLSRRRLRPALALLESTGRTVFRDLPDNEKQGGRKTYIHPVANRAMDSGAVESKIDVSAADPPSTAPASTTARPYRERESGAVDRRLSNSISSTAPSQCGAVPAQWRNSDPPIAETLSPLEQKTLDRLAGHPEGVDDAELKRGLVNAKGASAAMVDAALARLAAAGRVGKVNGRWILAEGAA